MLQSVARISRNSFSSTENKQKAVKRPSLDSSKVSRSLVAQLSEYVLGQTQAASLSLTKNSEINLSVSK